MSAPAQCKHLSSSHGREGESGRVLGAGGKVQMNAKMYDRHDRDLD